MDTCVVGAESGEWVAFQNTLTDVLQRTEESGDDAHLWQDAISLLKAELKNLIKDATDSSFQADAILDKARETISAHMQQQHRRYVMRERWNASRLSLLTAELLTALDETQIYEILAKHLSEMDIHTATLVMFDPAEGSPLTWAMAHNIMWTSQAPIRFPVREFPPPELFDEKQPFILTLIPIVDQSGQLGFMVFDAEHLDLYGTIVQQLSSALNTARLYRQATEGRRLAEEANRMKSRFLSTISHELRTPLNLIVGLSGIILKENEEGQSQIPEATHKDMKRIHAYAQHLGGLIGDVIDLATLEAGQLRLNKELLDLGEILQMVVESGGQLTADKGLAWRADIPATGPRVFGDRTRLRQVVLNLVNNAIKYTNQGEISLSLTSEGGLVNISVQDTGLGIPPEEQEVIFDAFRRSERSIALGYPGLGLGLAICKMLIEMHGGTIGLRSTGVEGEGSTFYITLPAEPAGLEQLAGAVEILPHKRTVLVLSSQLGVNQHLCKLLNQRGLEVQEAWAGNPADWQKKLDGVAPDVIVLDVTAQSDLDWMTLKAIKDNPATRSIPTLLYAISENGESLLNLDYITKPIELDELTRMLDQHGVPVDSAHPVRTCLIVDDEPDTLELHARIVQSQSTSNRVLLASNGIEALQFLRKEKVDIVLLDLQMPGMDGFGVLEAMRENKSTSKIPVIVITGKTLTGEDMERLHQGVAVVLKKGLFSPEETVAHIEATLEQRRNLSLDTRRLVRQAMAYIHEHYWESVSRQTIAQHISVSDD